MDPREWAKKRESPPLLDVHQSAFYVCNNNRAVSVEYKSNGGGGGERESGEIIMGQRKTF